MTGIVLIGSALLVLWFTHHRTSVGPSTRTRAVLAKPTDHLPSSNGLPLRTPEPLKQRAIMPSLATTRAPTALTTIDSDLADAISVERVGAFRELFDAWRAEEEDADATEDARTFFDTAFTSFAIHPLSEYIRCGTSLCRARFRYAELKELYRMREIEEPDGVKIATTFPEDEQGSQTVSVYWTRNPSPTGPLTETLGK